MLWRDRYCWGELVHVVRFCVGARSRAHRSCIASPATKLCKDYPANSWPVCWNGSHQQIPGGWKSKSGDFGELWWPGTPSPAKARVAAAQLQFGPLTFGDGDLWSPKFHFLQIPTKPFKGYTFDPTVKLFKSYTLNLLILIFKNCFWFIYFKFKNAF